MSIKHIRRALVASVVCAGLALAGGGATAHAYQTTDDGSRTKPTSCQPFYWQNDWALLWCESRHFASNGAITSIDWFHFYFNESTRKWVRYETYSCTSSGCRRQ
jgi:hypothetical protein